MGEEKGVRNAMPVEETIIDPLYEPLKLNRYELCPHLQRLKDVSHLRYGFSPYLLFDVDGWREVVEKIKGKDELSSEIEAFYDILKKYLELLDKLGDKEINKRNTLIRSLFGCRNTIIDVYTVIKMLSDVILIENMGRNELFGLNLNTEMSDLETESKKFLEIIDKNKDIYDQILNQDNSSIENKIASFAMIRGGKLNELKKKTLEIKEKYNRDYYSIIDSLDDPKKKELYLLIEKRFNKITHLYQLDYPVKVKCPKCKEEQFMCEEGKIYSMKEALLRTFELRRARWLQMSGSLHIVHRAATHTRLSHQIGSMIAGVNALREIDVYPRGSMSMSLGEYLLMSGELHEFLMANFLHDIGHPPLSHVLEPNPFIELDHEEITRNLILGKAVKGEGEEGMDWYVAERYLLKMKTIKDFEHRFFENRYDPIYNVGEEEWDEEERREKFLSYLGENGEILESEVVTVSEVLANFGVDKDRVVEILSGEIFCPRGCGKLLKIEDGKVEKCKTCEEARIEREKIYDTQFLNKLIESEVDLDRMDHVKRDSVVCGLSLISFRLLELLGSMSVVLPDSDAYEEIHNGGNKHCILISEDGLLYVMDLLTARKSVFKDILYSDENNWINGVVNQITALATRYLPHLTNMLPFITDQVLIQFYTNDLFLGTQIDKLNKLFHGKMDYSGYGTSMRYKLKDGVIITKDDLKKMYKKIEEINADSNRDRMEIPAVVFYTNIKETKCPGCKRNNLEEVNDSELAQNLKAGMVCGQVELLEEVKGIRECNLNVKVVRCKECKHKDEKGDEMRGEMLYLVGIEEGIFKLLKCPICGEKIIKERKDFQDFIECEKCGRMRKWNEENWDDIFVYEKKFKMDGDKKYFKFKDLVGKHKNTLRERFPERPSELDVKNLFYVWVSDFVVSDGNANENNGNKTKNEWIDYIKTKIGAIWTGEKFMERFVDLDEIHRGDENDSY